jgi:YD repeat-containing protein
VCVISLNCLGRSTDLSVGRCRRLVRRGVVVTLILGGFAVPAVSLAAALSLAGGRLTLISWNLVPEMADGKASADGRFVGFTSSRSLLAPGGGEKASNTYVYDNRTAQREFADRATGGTPWPTATAFHAISRDGRFVSFERKGTGVSRQFYVRDRQSGTTEAVSVAGNGSLAFGGVISGAVMNSTGRFFGFATFQLTSTSPVSRAGYIRDVDAGVTELVSVDSNEVPPGGSPGTVQITDISSDGRFVVMITDAQLAADDIDAAIDVYVRDRVVGTTERVSLSSAGEPLTGGPAGSLRAAQVSSDGRYVAFITDATNAFPGDSNAAEDVVVRDRVLGTTTRAISASGGGQVTTGINNFDMTDDGKGFAFVPFAGAMNVAPGDNNAGTDAFFSDSQTKLTELVSIAPTGDQADSTVKQVAFIDGTSRRVTFSSLARTQPDAPSGGLFLVDRGGAPKPIPVPQTIGDGCGNSLGSTTGACQADGGLDEDVDGENGGLSQSATDARLSGRGVTFAFSRSYASVDTATGGRLGAGWTYPYQAGLVLFLNGDIDVRSEDGQTVTYVHQPDGSFKTPDGVTSTLAAVSSGYTLTGLDQSRLSFDGQGRLTQMVDQTNQGLAFAYTGSDLTMVTDADGKQVALTYDPTSHQLTRLTLPDGRFVAYTYRLADGRLETVRDLRGGITTYTYDAAGRLDGVKDQLNHWTIRVVYDAEGRIVEKRDALDNLTTYAWDAVTGTQTRTDPRGGVWKDVPRQETGRVSGSFCVGVGAPVGACR